MAELTLREYSRKIGNLIDRGQHAEAVAHCKHILEQYPKLAAAYELLGRAMLEAHQDEHAADLFRRVLSADPENLTAWVGLSELAGRKNDLDASIMYLERAFELAPDNRVVGEELRRLYGQRDGTEPSKIPLGRAALARLYLRGDLLPRAIAEFRAAISGQANRTDLHIPLSEALWRNGRRLEASEVAQEALSSYPYSVKANFVLGEVLSGGDRDEGAAFLQRAHQMDPEHEVAAAIFGDASPLRPNEASVSVLTYVPEPEGERPSWMAETAAGTGDGFEEDVEELLAGGEAPPRRGPSTDQGPQIEIPAWLKEIGQAEVLSASGGELAEETPPTWTLPDEQQPGETDAVRAAEHLVAGHIGPEPGQERLMGESPESELSDAMFVEQLLAETSMKTPQAEDESSPEHQIRQTVPGVSSLTQTEEGVALPRPTKEPAMKEEVLWTELRAMDRQPTPAAASDSSVADVTPLRTPSPEPPAAEPETEFHWGSLAGGDSPQRQVGEVRVLPTEKAPDLPTTDTRRDPTPPDQKPVPGEEVATGKSREEDRRKRKKLAPVFADEEFDWSALRETEPQAEVGTAGSEPDTSVLRDTWPTGEPSHSETNTLAWLEQLAAEREEQEQPTIARPGTEVAHARRELAAPPDAEELEEPEIPGLGDTQAAPTAEPELPFGWTGFAKPLPQQSAGVETDTFPPVSAADVPATDVEQSEPSAEASAAGPSDASVDTEEAAVPTRQRDRIARTPQEMLAWLEQVEDATLKGAEAPAEAKSTGEHREPETGGPERNGRPADAAATTAPPEAQAVEKPATTEPLAEGADEPATGKGTPVRHAAGAAATHPSLERPSEPERSDEAQLDGESADAAAASTMAPDEAAEPALAVKRAYLEQRPRDYDAWLSLARALWRGDEKQDALEAYRRLIDRGKLLDAVIDDLGGLPTTERDLDTQLALGDAYMKLGRLDEALSVYRQSLQTQ